MAKYYRTLTVNLLCAAAILSATQGITRAAPANLLANSGFETGNFSGWTVGGNSVLTGVDLDETLIPSPPVDFPFPPNFVNVLAGQYAGWAVVKDGNDPVERIILSQVIAVVPGENYTASFSMANDSALSFGIRIDDLHTQIFVDGVGILPLDAINLSAGTGPGDFRTFSGSFNSGLNAFVTVEFAINGSGIAHVGTSFDEFSVSGEPVPDSGSSAFTLSVALGGLLIVARLRREEARARK